MVSFSELAYSYRNPFICRVWLKFDFDVSIDTNEIIICDMGWHTGTFTDWNREERFVSGKDGFYINVIVIQRQWKCAGVWVQQDVNHQQIDRNSVYKHNLNQFTSVRCSTHETNKLCTCPKDQTVSRDVRF